MNGQSGSLAPGGLSVALWRLAAGIAFLFAFLFIKYDLLGATLLLAAAVLCLPGIRVAISEKTGVRIPGLINAMVVAVLVIFGVDNVGWGHEPLPGRAPVDTAPHEESIERSPGAIRGPAGSDTPPGMIMEHDATALGSTAQRDAPQ